jgi:uncharacterized membrane protein YdjX (TVP38/TMEM64 family)
MAQKQPIVGREDEANKHDISKLDLIEFRKYSQSFIQIFLLLVGIPIAIYVLTGVTFGLFAGFWLTLASIFTIGPFMHFKYLEWLCRRLEKKPLFYKEWRLYKWLKKKRKK